MGDGETYGDGVVAVGFELCDVCCADACAVDVSIGGDVQFCSLRRLEAWRDGISAYHVLG